MTLFGTVTPEQVIDDTNKAHKELPDLPDHVRKDAGVIIDTQAEVEAKIARLTEQINAKRQQIVDQCLLSIASITPEMQMDVLNQWMGLDAKAFPLSAAFAEVFDRQQS